MVRIAPSVVIAILSLDAISFVNLSMRYFGSVLSPSPVMVSSPKGISCGNVSIRSFGSILIPSWMTVFSPNGICFGDMSIRDRDSAGRWHLVDPLLGWMGSTERVLSKSDQGTVACVLLNEYTSNVMINRIYNPLCFIPRLDQWNYLVLSLDSRRGEEYIHYGCGWLLHLIHITRVWPNVTPGWVFRKRAVGVSCYTRLEEQALRGV